MHPTRSEDVGWQVVTELAQSLGKPGLCQQTSIREGRREKRSKEEKRGAVQGLLYSSGQPTDDLGPSPDMLSSESSEVSRFSLTKKQHEMAQKGRPHLTSR